MISSAGCLTEMGFFGALSALGEPQLRGLSWAVQFSIVFSGNHDCAAKIMPQCIQYIYIYTYVNIICASCPSRLKNITFCSDAERIRLISLFVLYPGYLLRF